VFWDSGDVRGFDRVRQGVAIEDVMGQWNHWAFSKNSNTGEVNIFLNGELWHQETGHFETMEGITDIVLGEGPLGENYDGLIDDVRVYTEALSGSAVTEVYNEGLNGDSAPIFVDASDFASSNGISVQASSDVGGGQAVAFDAVGDETSYQVIVPIAGTYLVDFRVASTSGLLNLELTQNGVPLTTLNRVIEADTWTNVHKMITLQAGNNVLTVSATDGEPQFLNSFELTASNGHFESFMPETPINIALNQTTSASNIHSSGFATNRAVDENLDTRWATAAGNPTPWLEVNFEEKNVFVYGMLLEGFRDRISSYELQVYNDGDWVTFFTGGNPEDGQMVTFSSVWGSRFRFQVLSSTESPSLFELKLFGEPDSDFALSLVDNTDSILLEWPNSFGGRYSVQRSTDLGVNSLWETIESGIPALTETNSISVEKEDGAAVFYRIILDPSD